MTTEQKIDLHDEWMKAFERFKGQKAQVTPYGWFVIGYRLAERKLLLADALWEHLADDAKHGHNSDCETLSRFVIEYGNARTAKASS